MALKISTGLAEYLAGTGSLRAAFNGSCRLSLYDGTAPVGADLATTGSTLLCEILGDGSDPLEFESDVTNGVLTKLASQTWVGTNAATGTATWFRLESSSDNGLESSSALRMQGSVGTVFGDMVMVQPNLVNGNAKAIEHCRFVIPTSSSS